MENLREGVGEERESLEKNRSLSEYHLAESQTINMHCKDELMMTWTALSSKQTFSALVCA